MNTKSTSVIFVVLAAFGCAGVYLLFCRGTDKEEGRSAVPSFQSPTGTVVRALPPSALGAHVATERKPPTVPSLKAVLTITDAANDSLNARLAALATLGKVLPDSEVEALLDFLDRRDGEDVLPPEKLNALKNDVVNLLRAQSKFPPVLSTRLAAMWGDAGHDNVWRDYCIQHAGAAWGRVSDPAVRVEIRTLLWAAASEPAEPGSGTALISLRNLVSSGAEDQMKVAERAGASASPSVSAPDGVRVTALQIAAELEYAETASLARPILMDRSQPIHLRMSAAAALGRVGDVSDLASLDTLANSSEPRLRASASAAAARIRQKIK
ncbi:MAG: hypothetical protein WC328_00460 [Kiritimatiellia bacterium]|jgi:hypothetical protein|nr:hypothetical protein [Kiritimatiellia bacterium]MDD4172717.1 hypothetical protein [Kiritimatiellia bacterium]MDD4440801.1 hypothetical protein [Kiritimatiellia bacterium]MDX9792119.1 hypothetical protein [Kiritimatiellia bacterium]